MVTKARNDIQHQNNSLPQTSPTDYYGVLLTDATWYLYPYHDIENTELHKWNVHLKPDRKQ